MITKDMLIFDLLQRYPAVGKVLQEKGMKCFGCMGADEETVAEGAKMHGINIDTLLEDLNKAIDKKI